MENNLKYELFTKYYNNNKYKKTYEDFVEDFLKNKHYYILTNIDTDIVGLNPMIVPIKGTDFLAVCLFESEEICDKYINDNNLYHYAESTILTKDILLMTLEKLFYKGLTGILYNGFFINEIKTTYIPIYLIGNIINNRFLTLTNENIVKVLNKALLNKEYLYYIYHPTLNIDEIFYGIVRFKEEQSKSKTINLFVNREVIESYCEKNKIISNKVKMIINQAKSKIKKSNKEVLDEINADKSKEIYPTTSIKNDVLFHAMNVLKNRKNLNINTIKIHDLKEVYSISLDDFIDLIIKVGFPQLDLS